MLFLQLVHVPHHHDGSDDCGREVGDRHTVPYAVNTPDHRQESQERQENEQLSREREEDAYLHLSDALEEVGDNHLETDDREAEHNHSDCLDAQVYQLLIGREHSCAVVRQEHRYQPSYHHDGGGGNDAQVQYAHQSVQFLGSIVVACNRLHSLVNAEHKHHEHHRNTVGYSVGTHREVASESYQLVVDEDNDDAGAYVHQEGRNADGKYIIHEFSLQLVDAFLEVEQLILVAEELELPHHSHQLR